jgi:hypothetical protein
MKAPYQYCIASIVFLNHCAFLLSLPVPQYLFTQEDGYLNIEMYVGKKTNNIFELVIYYNVELAI